MGKNRLGIKQRKFLSVLFHEAGGDPKKAKELAGYSKTTRLAHILRHLKDEIAEATKEYIATSGPQAAVALTNIIKDPTALGNKDKMAAAKDILDRGGIKAADKVEVTAHNPLFILPEKKKDE